MNFATAISPRMQFRISKLGVHMYERLACVWPAYVWHYVLCCFWCSCDKEVCLGGINEVLYDTPDSPTVGMLLEVNGVFSKTIQRQCIWCFTSLVFVYFVANARSLGFEFISSMSGRGQQNPGKVSEYWTPGIFHWYAGKLVKWKGQLLNPLRFIGKKWKNITTRARELQIVPLHFDFTQFS